MKILTIIGARPQMIKAAAVSDVIRQSHQEILVHTGQHYDANMSDVFFNDLKIPRPDYYLGVGSGLHGYQTGKMIIKIEEILLQERPDAVLVYGDTNSTLAGAIAASKLLIPIVHVEAGLRSYNRDMPEEQNRVLTDHVSAFLFTPTETASANLRREGITDGIFHVGDVMYDAALKYIPIAKKTHISGLRNTSGYVLATIHRASNTDNPSNLKHIIDALNGCDRTIVLPLHPRTRKCIQSYGLTLQSNICTLVPVGYLEMLRLENEAEMIVTDSGGVQKEAYFAGKPCITMRNETEWMETVEAGWNVLVGADTEKILSALRSFRPQNTPLPLYGDGHAAQKICDILNGDYAKQANKKLTSQETGLKRPTG